MELAELLAARLRASADVAGGDGGAARLRQPAPARRFLAGAGQGRARAPGATTAPPTWAAAGGSTSSTARPIRPGRCTSGTAAAPYSATRSRACSPRWASRSRASTTSTTTAPRSTCWRARCTTAIWQRWAALRRSRPQGWYPAEELIARRRRRSSAADGDRWLDAAEADWLPVFRSRGVAAMLELIRDDLGRARRAPRRVHLGGGAGRRRAHRGGAGGAGAAGAGLRGRPAAAQGQAERRLGAATAAAVPLDRVRRRRRPAAQAGGRGSGPTWPPISRTTSTRSGAAPRS